VKLSVAALLRGAALVPAAIFSLSGCEQPDPKKAPTATKERSQVVVSTAGPTAAATTAAPSAPPAGKVRRELCAGEMGKPGRDMAKSAISRASAPGVAPVAESVQVGGGKWTWINFWAAWCVPCKEEMPRLRSWEQKLSAASKPFRLVFVTLDDDERQLSEFLKREPAGGVRSTYWLREGKEREEYLTALGVSADPELPAHVLVDPRGKVRCVVNGAVEDDDYPQVLALIGG
jgi:thiol-disulfide isomerase/thioredoxin